jgi:hypothetical protein
MLNGGQGVDPTYSCVSPGMPRIMIAYAPMEVVVTPEVTYILMERDHDHYRRIYTDGRGYPSNMDVEPRFLGYSIGQWLDEDGDGKFDTLVVETRGLKGPRVYDATGIPLHEDNQSIIKERIYLDKADKNLLHDDITTIDHALTEPWLVKKTYRRFVSEKPIWFNTASAAKETSISASAARSTCSLATAVDADGEEPAAARPALFQALRAVAEAPSRASGREHLSPRAAIGFNLGSLWEHLSPRAGRGWIASAIPGGLATSLRSAVSRGGRTWGCFAFAHPYKI